MSFVAIACTPAGTSRLRSLDASKASLMASRAFPVGLVPAFNERDIDLEQIQDRRFPVHLGLASIRPTAKPIREVS